MCVHVVPCVAYAQLVSSLHRESERYAKLIRMCACACACGWHLRLFVKFSLTFVLHDALVTCLCTPHDTETIYSYTHTCMALGSLFAGCCRKTIANGVERAAEGARNNSLS